MDNNFNVEVTQGNRRVQALINSGIEGLTPVELDARVDLSHEDMEFFLEAIDYYCIETKALPEGAVDRISNQKPYQDDLDVLNGLIETAEANA